MWVAVFDKVTKKKKKKRKEKERKRKRKRKKVGSEFAEEVAKLQPKETKLERADFTLQLSISVTAKKERRMFIIFFLLSFCQLLSP